MTRYFTALAAAGAVALTTLAVPTEADARVRGRHIAGGVIGLAAGAIIGSAIANSRARYYEPGYVYEPGYAPAYGYEPGYAYDYAPAYGYGYYGGATSDITNRDRMLQGSR